MIVGKFINKYYIKYLLPITIGILTVILVDWTQLYLPEYLGDLVNLFDENINGSQIDKNILVNLFLKVLIVGAIIFLGRILWRFMLLTTSKKIETSLRKDMYLKAERLSLEYYHDNKIGSIMSWFTTDLETIEECTGWGTLRLVDAIFLTIFALVKMFSLSWGLSLIAIVPILLIALWGALVEKFMNLKWDQRQKAYDEMYDFTQESFSGIRVIKAFVKKNQQIHQFAKIAKKNKTANISFYKIAILFDVIISILIAVISTIIMGFGGWMVYQTIIGSPINIFSYKILLDAGKLTTFLGYFDTLIWPMMALGQVVTMTSRGNASYKRISSFLNAEEKVKDAVDAKALINCRGEIEFKHFSFIYPNSKKEILSDINLKINPGETIGVIGKVGCGKSSLFSSLLRFYNINKNQVFIDGKDIMSIKIKSLRDNIAISPQDTFLFQDKIKNNISFYEENEVEMERIIEAAEFADIDNNIQEFVDKYETVTGERGQNVSGGQKQRISIARAYIKKAPILILDDCVSAVDLKTEENILNNIKEKRKEKTTILISSRVSTVSKLDKIVVLKDGKLEAFDTPNKLLKISQTYKHMYDLQKLELEEVVTSERK